MSDDPKEEIAIAVAGPAVNVVIAAGLWLGMAMAGLPPQVTLFGLQDASFGSLGEAALTTMFNVNLALVLFNLIPAFPMDGGRILRALLAMVMPYARATQIAAWIGQGLAIVFGILGLFVNPLLVFIAFFIFAGAQQEAAMARFRDARR
jgi:Zn-dependent protease